MISKKGNLHQDVFVKHGYYEYVKILGFLIDNICLYLKRYITHMKGFIWNIFIQYS
jgi:hypothetical protein